jgi:translocation and assembly module TamB
MRITRLATQLVRWLTRAIFALGLMWGASMAHADDAADKSWFVQWVEGTISTPDRKISLGRIDGTLSSDVRIDRITIADKQGVWLTIEGAHLIWSRTALFKGVLAIDRLEATSITVARPPVASAVPSATASAPISLPDLPISIVLKALAVPVIHLEAPVAGSDMNFKVAASAKFDGDGLKARVDAQRGDGVDGHVRFDLDYAAAAKTLALDLDYGEPKGGVLAHLFNLPGDPALGLALKGSGPLGQFRADLTIEADGRQVLSGTTRIVRTTTAYSVASDLVGSFGSLAQGAAASDYFSGPSQLSVALDRFDDGSIDVQKLDLKSGVLILAASAHLAKDGFPTRLAIDGSLAKNSQPVHVSAGGATIDGAKLALTFGDGLWTARIDATQLAGTPVTARTVSLAAKGKASDLGDAAKRTIDFDVTGALTGLSASDPALADAVAGNAQISATGRWQAGQPLTVSAIHAERAQETIDAKGTLHGATVTGDVRLVSSGLKRYARLAGIPLAGSADLTIAGTFAALTGAFDVTVTGAATGLVADGKLAPLLNPETRIAGHLQRDIAGTHVSGVRLANDRLSLGVDGALDTTSIDLTASAALTNVADLTDRARGRVTLDAQLKGPVEAADVSVRLASAALKLGSHRLDGATVALSGRGGLDRFIGALSLGGRLDAAPVTMNANLDYAATGAKAVKDMRFALRRASITGDLALNADNLIDGRIVADIPEFAEIAPLLLVEGRGALKATVALSAANGHQDGRIEAHAADFVAGGASLRKADAAVSVSDLLGVPAAVGSVTIKSAKIGSLDVAEARLGFTPMSSPGTRFNADAALATGPVHVGGAIVPAAGGFDVALDAARAVYQGQTFALKRPTRIAKRPTRIEIAPTEISLPQSGAMTLAGTVPLDGSELALTGKGNASLALLNPTLRERGAKADGRIDLDVAVTGRTTAPSVRGRVTIAGGSLVDPETGMRLSNLTARLALDGKRLRIESASATTGKQGTISATGGMALSAPLDADLSVRFAGAELSSVPLAQASIDGTITLRGPLLTKPTVAGALTVTRAEITIPERFAANVAALNVKLIGAPAAVRKTEARAFAKAGPTKSKASAAFDAVLDVRIEVPSRMFVRGRGVDAELGGTVRLTGTLAAPQPTGALTLRRGALDVAGKHVQFDSGSVTLLGDLDPLLDFKLSSSANGITVTIALTGNASDPALVLSSTPDLPQDEILSQFLFGHNVAELSGTQLIQLASAAAQLAGGSSGGGLLAAIRTSTGLDSFGTTTDRNGNVALQAGRYISDRIYLGVVTGSKGTTDATVNIDVTKNLKLQLEAGQSENKAGLIFQKEY